MRTSVPPNSPTQKIYETKARITPSKVSSRKKEKQRGNIHLQAIHPFFKKKTQTHKLKTSLSSSSNLDNTRERTTNQSHRWLPHLGKPKNTNAKANQPAITHHQISLNQTPGFLNQNREERNQI
jgi:hypothetical protein